MSEEETLLRKLVELQERQLAESRQTNHLLLMLIEAMGEEDSDPDDEPVTYIDGSPVR